MARHAPLILNIGGTGVPRTLVVETSTAGTTLADRGSTIQRQSEILIGMLPMDRTTAETNMTRDTPCDIAALTRKNMKIDTNQKPKERRWMKRQKTGRVTIPTVTVITNIVDVLSPSLAHSVQGLVQIAPCHIAVLRGIRIIVIAQVNGEGLGPDPVL